MTNIRLKVKSRAMDFQPQMKMMKLFRRQGSNFCLQYVTVHNHIWLFGLSVREIVEITRRKTHFLSYIIPAGTSMCHLHLRVVANGQGSCAATTEIL